MKIITREDARAKGLKFYFTGEPCKHGHICKRYVSNRYCVECQRAHQQTPKYKAYSRAYDQTHNLKQYGITPADYDAKLHAQNGVCAICQGDNGEKRLCVDHDHKTDRVRGLLCNRCNVMLGFAEEERELLGAPFVHYLDKWEDF